MTTNQSINQTVEVASHCAASYGPCSASFNRSASQRFQSVWTGIR